MAATSAPAEEGKVVGEPQRLSLEKNHSTWASLRQWVSCICVVTFDLELGQAIEVQCGRLALRPSPLPPFLRPSSQNMPTGQSLFCSFQGSGFRAARPDSWHCLWEQLLLVSSE